MTANGLNIVLCGFMASGKTTVGRMLSEITGREFIDTDSLIEKEGGVTIAEIFEQDGESLFRELERETIERISRQKGRIIAFGGGAVLDRRNVDAVRQNAVVYWLKVTSADVLSRAADIDGRPLLPDGIERVEELLLSREKAYAEAADVVIETGCKSVAKVAWEIASDFRARAPDEKV